MRDQLGVWLKDRWRYERALRSPSPGYLALANRLECLEKAPDGSGFSCRWTFTSKLHAPGIQPRLGQRLIRRCLENAPIRSVSTRSLAVAPPDISVLIGHRGRERLPLLLATLDSLAAQQDVHLECLVIEQAAVSEIVNDLPDWVRHVLAPLADDSAPYNRSQTFNVGARKAQGGTLLLHDNDMLVPAGYCRRILDRRARGYEVINPKRYIFYLTENHSKALQSELAQYDSFPPDYIVQNLEAGGSMAISAAAFEDIGGMDEGFVGWGGEDNEFWDRCLTLPTWIWGYEPIVHLWHRSQPLKDDLDNPNILRCRAIMQCSPCDRIAALKLSRGMPS
jgi:N-terminal domain of galactosyltransferase